MVSWSPLVLSQASRASISASAVPLVCLDGHAETLEAALRYLLFALLGSILYLLGVGLVRSLGGAVWRFDLAHSQIDGADNAWSLVTNLDYSWVLLGKNIDKLADLKILAPESRQPFCRSNIGMAVLKGAPKPDISTVEAFKRTLLECQSVAHTEFGPSGAYFPGLMVRLGIAAQIKPKEVTRPGGYIGVVVAAGEAQMCFQQICELLAVPGIDVIGPIPDELQFDFDTQAAIFTDSRNRSAARELLAYFAQPMHAATFKRAGLIQLPLAE